MPDYSTQLEQVVGFIKGRKIGKDSPIWRKTLAWVQNFPLPDVAAKERLVRAMCFTFDTTEDEIYRTIVGEHLATPKSREEEIGEDDLAKIIPANGWFDEYSRFTRKTESPLSYHLFSSLCVLGAAIGRKCWLDMGFYRLFPNYAVVLIGPPGRVKKTSAVNVARDFIHSGLCCPIMADKITPEALVLSLAKKGGHHFIYAPEFSILMGRQKYNEGLTTLFLRILDCPDHWATETVTRGEVELTNLVPIILGASTLSLLANSTPNEVTSSGFLSRFVMVVETDTLRSYPVPEKGEVGLWRSLTAHIERMKAHQGEISFSAEGREYYNEWYAQRKRRMRTDYDPTTAEVLERQPDHFLRTAALAHLVLHDSHEICRACLQFASSLLSYVEKRIPQTVSTIGKVVSSQDTDYVLEALRRLGGVSDHSRLLRRVSSRMDATAFRRHLASLVEQRIIREEKRGAVKFYVLIREEEAPA